MPAPSESNQPRLAAGCRWGGTEENRVILFPEGAIKLQGTGRQVLEQCDGQRTFGELIRELQGQFGDADPNKIRDDISPEDLLRALVGMCYLHDQPGWQTSVLRLLDVFIDGLRIRPDRPRPRTKQRKSQ